MNLRSLLASTLALAAPALVLAAAPIVPAPAVPAALQGDADHGAALYRLHCAACHGPGGRGDGLLSRSLTAPRPADLRDPPLLLQRGDPELFEAIARGGRSAGLHPTMPGFEDSLDPLDVWDLVALLRRDQPAITDFFPDAARYTARTYTLDRASLARLAPLLGELSPAECQVPVVAVFGGKRPADGPVFVPQDPRALDTLEPRRKLGYLTFVTVQTPWAERPAALALAFDREGFITHVRADLEGLAPAERARAEKIFASFVGLGGKAYDYEDFKAPRVPSGQAAEASKLAKGFTRAYYRALEGAVMFDKEERERTWAD
jgi:mono/diheme cytochrome c family protein